MHGRSYRNCIKTLGDFVNRWNTFETGAEREEGKIISRLRTSRLANVDVPRLRGNLRFVFRSACDKPESCPVPWCI